MSKGKGCPFKIPVERCRLQNGLLEAAVLSAATGTGAGANDALGTVRARGSASHCGCTAGCPGCARHHFLPRPHPRPARERREADGSAGGCSLSVQLPPQLIASPGVPGQGWAGRIRLGGAETRGTCRGTPNWAAATPPTPHMPLGLGSASWDVALGRRAVVQKTLQDICICPLCVQCLLFACGTSPVTATCPYRTRTFSAVSPLPLQPDVPCACGPMGRHRAQLSLPGDAVPQPTASQAGALWAADQLEAIGCDGKGNRHVMGMGTWPGLEQGHPQDRGHSWEAVAHLQAWWLSSPVPL